MRLWPYITLLGVAWRNVFCAEQETLNTQNRPDFRFSKKWQILGPFAIGTREALWSADPLEYHGGFHSLDYDQQATFKSSLAFNGTVFWSEREAQLSFEGDSRTDAALDIKFPEIDWRFLQNYYGTPSLQWQAWARGEINVHAADTKTLILHAENVIEYWIDDVRYFGGDFYAYRRAPLTLHLEPGVHQIDIKLVRDIRSMGAFTEAGLDVKLELQRSSDRLQSLLGFDRDILISDVIGGDWGPLASPYASIVVRNDAENDIYIDGIEGMPDTCEVELLSKGPIKLVAGQSRPVGFRIGCIPSLNRRINLKLKYSNNGFRQTMSMSKWPRVLPRREDPHRITFLHPSGIVSYAVLRPPEANLQCGQTGDQSLPVLIELHGAGVEADSDEVKHALDPLGDICAWILYPSGVTSWSGDDWHNWGFADIEAAVAAIPDWIEQVEWDGPGVDIDKWLISGHSNGGQGTWYTLTHRPDKLIAAAASSGFCSVQSYVPYIFWHSSDPGRAAVVQGALLTYQHELLLENAKDIPVYQQHGTLDDNVPAYQSRLLSQRIQQAGAESTYVELPGRPHYWDGVMTTRPLSQFYKEQLSMSERSPYFDRQNLHDFSIISGNPGDTGSKHGMQILELGIPGRLGRLDFTFDPIRRSCLLRVSNVVVFIVPNEFDECDFLMVDGDRFDLSTESVGKMVFTKDEDGWHVSQPTGSSMPPLQQRHGRQLGAMNAILRSHGTFSIVRHSKGVEHIALQISRNFCQYFAADTEITDDYDKAIASDGNIISIALGSDLPTRIRQNPAIEVGTHDISVRHGNYWRTYPSIPGLGLAAAFLRPLPNERLELVVWAADKRDLRLAARLVPTMTGGGQPDFIVVDRKMMWKGVEGTLAMGFLDTYWNVSANSFLS